MKKIKYEKFTTHSECLDYLKEELSNKRYKGIYIEENNKKIRPGIGILLERIKRHSPEKEKNTVKLKGFKRKSILVIPLMEYFDNRFISHSELSYLETKLIELIKKKSKKKNLANKSYKEGDLHKIQKDELDKLFEEIISWIDKNWKIEFYGRA